MPTGGTQVAQRAPAGRAGPFRVALIGAGGISEEHVSALARIPSARLVAVCDLAVGRARKLASTHGIPDVCETPAELFERVRPDVVHVLTPPEHHTNVALESVRAGCHTFVEKPLGLSSAACRELRAAAAEHGRRVGVNHNCVSRTSFQSLLSLIRAGRLGRVLHVNVTYSTSPSSVPRDPGHFLVQHPSNALFEIGPHPFSLVRRILGPVKRVVAHADEGPSSPFGARSVPSFQAAIAAARGTAHLYLSVGRGFRDVSVVVHGEDGVASADLARNSVRLFENADRHAYADIVQSMGNARRSLSALVAPFKERVVTALGLPGDPAMHPMLLSVRSFYDALASGAAPPEGIEEGIQVVEYCEAARDAVAAPASPKASLREQRLAVASAS